MNHTCPACHASIPDDAIGGRGVALCKNCDATVRFEQTPEGWRVAGHTEAAAPDGITVHVDEASTRNAEGYRDTASTPGRFEASRRWFTPMVPALTLCAALWAGFLVVWYSIATSIPNASARSVFWFPLLHVAVGIGLTWYVLANWFNRTRIVVQEGHLSTRAGPIPAPWSRNKELKLRDVELFRAEFAKVTVQKYDEDPVRLWNVVARTRGGSDVVVVAGLPEEIARYLARRLQRQL
ncbi:MAG: hypothetical protein AAGE52_42995 [Myxococcota bacterium]